MYIFFKKLILYLRASCTHTENYWELQHSENYLSFIVNTQDIGRFVSVQYVISRETLIGKWNHILNNFLY